MDMLHFFLIVHNFKKNHRYGRRQSYNSIGTYIIQVYI